MCFFLNKATLVKGSYVFYACYILPSLLSVLQAVVVSDRRGRTMVGRGDADYCVMGYNVFRMTDNFIAFRKWGNNNVTVR